MVRRQAAASADRCDIALPSDAISRVHCTIDQRPDGAWLVDRSRHGTPVNGEAQPETRLSAGAELQIGPLHPMEVPEYDPADRPELVELPPVLLRFGEGPQIYTMEDKQAKANRRVEAILLGR